MKATSLATGASDRCLESGCSRQGDSAFALVDLLVVIAILALFAFFVLTALASPNINPHPFQCLNNLKQLTIAWRAYAEDSSDRLVNNFGLDAVMSEISRTTYRNWINDIMDWSTGSTTYTNLLPPRKGLLLPYSGTDGRIYRCPADTYLSTMQRAAGWSGRSRSYSMNGFFGPYDSNPNGTWASGRNTFFTNYRQWLRCAQVARPASAWVFIEEHPDSINDGYFINNPAFTGAWGDIPASFHNGACGIAFADGHVEMHRWLSTKSKIPVRYGYTTPTLDASGRTDYQWLLTRTAVLY